MPTYRLYDVILFYLSHILAFASYSLELTILFFLNIHIIVTCKYVGMDTLVLNCLMQGWVFQMGNVEIIHPQDLLLLQFCVLNLDHNMNENYQLDIFQSDLPISVFESCKKMSCTFSSHIQ